MPPSRQKQKKASAPCLYEVTCEGQYYAFSNGQKSINKYSVKAVLSEKAKDAGFLSVFRNEILAKPEIMQRTFPDWKRFRTHIITQTVNLTYKNQPVKELGLMNRRQIINFINARGLEIEPDLYPEVTDLRQAVVDLRTDEESFLKQQEKRRRTKGPQLAVKRSVLDLNPWLRDDSQAAPPTLDSPPAKIPGLPGTPAMDPRIPLNAAPQQEFLPDDDADIIFEEDPLGDPYGIPDFDHEDELDALIAGV